MQHLLGPHYSRYGPFNYRSFDVLQIDGDSIKTITISKYHLLGEYSLPLDIEFDW